MNRLILHFGTPKTGTTAIQYFLHDNKDQLLELGYEYPDTRLDFPKDNGYTKINNNESAFANGNFIIDSQVLTAYEQGPEAFDEILKYVFPDIAEFYREVMGSNETDFEDFIGYIREKLEKNHVIISSENLWTFQYDFLKRFVQEFGTQLEVIIYLRRQDRYAESMWNEAVKLGITSLTVEEYFDFMLAEENDNHGLRYAKRLKEICEIIGKERLSVRLYEPEILRQTGGIYQDFLSMIGVDYTQYEWIIQQRDVNERICGSAVNVKRVFNEYLLQKEESKEKILNHVHDHIREFNNIFYRLSLAYARSQSSKDSYFSRSERMRMEQLFAGDNTYIAKEFFGKKEGEPLFTDNDWQIEQNVQPLTINEESMLRLFFEVCYK